MTTISARGLYKVFGKDPKKAIAALENGASREELMEKGSTAAVIDASFDVEPGEIFVIMGLSGCGKSTLIRMVNGLLPASGGTLEIDGTPLTEMSESQLRELRRDKISMVFQHFALLPHRTVQQNAAYGLEIKGVPKAEREEKAHEALRMVDLDGWADYMPGELSGGMQQRVGLARALAADTDVLLMDEAFSALDPLIRKDMQDQLIELQGKLNKTILFITHDLNEAMRIGDRIAMMRSGRIEQIGTAEEILQNPANNFVADFVKDVDRSRVLTADNIVEQPKETLGAGHGPLAAQKLLRETQNPWLVVLNRDRTPAGVVWEDAVARAVRNSEDALPLNDGPATHTIHKDTPLHELFQLSADSPTPIVVTDDAGRFCGVVPRVTLLSAAATESSDTATTTVADDDAARAETTGNTTSIEVNE